MKTKVYDALFEIGNSFIMLIVSIVSFYPFVYMVMLSFSSGNVFGKALLWPQNFNIIPYQMLITKVDFFSGFPVSILRSTIGPLLTIFVSFMAAYALSRDDLLFRKQISRIIVFSMYFSAGLLPVYMNMASLHLTNTFLVYIIPRMLNAFEMILIRTYIQSMPRTLEESAMLDGANDLKIAFRIIFPLCLPVIAAVLLFEFVGQWNAYTDTLLYNAQRPNLFTLQYILSNFLAKNVNILTTDFSNRAAYDSFNINALRMAMTVLLCVPIVIVYPSLQKYFVKGIMVGSIKG